MAVPAKLAPYLTEKDLDGISLSVADAESRTSGEIRVHIVYNLLPLEKPRARAIREFFRLGMDKTRDSTGVLIFLALKKQRFEIVADRGVNERVEEATWERIARAMEARIREAGLTDGICEGVRQIGEVLATHFPRQPEDRNELSDKVSLDEAGA